MHMSRTASPPAGQFDWSDPPWRTPRAAYVHVPFCAHHCGYCDFAVAAGRDHLTDSYLNALEIELRLSLSGSPRPVESIFLGGGTPTQLNAAQLERLLRILDRWLVRVGKAEYTIEANPESVDEEKVELLAAHGVNRLSLGAQSFQRAVLSALDRRHEPAAIVRAVEMARGKMASISLDLIFAAPGQTLDQWCSDLEQAINLQPDHLSTYCLTYEKGTPLWKRRRRGELAAASDELERAMYAHAIDALTAAGLDHYEISNFARPGRQCRHNQVYWANHAYYGFGLGAAGYVDGVRATNTRDLDRYLDALHRRRRPIQSCEALPPADRARETAMLQIRRAPGIAVREFQLQTGYRLHELLGDAVTRNQSRGWLAVEPDRVCLTREGFFFADTVCADFLA